LYEQGKGGRKYKYKINPDKANGNMRVECYSDYLEIIEKLILKYEITDYVIRRIDFRFDDYYNFYNVKRKIHRISFLCLDMIYLGSDLYESVDFKTLQDLCIRLQNPNIEAEYYNKLVAESQSGIENRLELRYKRRNDKLGDEFKVFELYCNLIRKAITVKNFDKACSLANKAIIGKCKSDPNFSEDKCNYYIFLYQNYIYSEFQLEDLCSALSSQKVTDIEDIKNNMEFVVFDELSDYWKQIIDIGVQFFER
jgi:hypothetical protein